MRTKKELNEDFLQPLSQVERAVAKPFLSGRVMSRLHQERHSSMERVIYFLTRPAFIVGMLLLCLALDFFVIQNRAAHGAAGTENEFASNTLPYESYYSNNLEP